MSTNTSSGPTRRQFLCSAASATIAVKAIPSLSLAAAQSSALTPETTGLNYHPQGLYVWDIWFFTRGDEVHLLHLQKKRPGSERPDRDDGAIGHAISTDLLHWEELPPALYRGPQGSIDDLDLFTGCATMHEGKCYLFYTARSSRENGVIQRLCVATSDDCIHWDKHPDPVIEPDPRWYKKEDCRDLIIQKHPDTGEFHGFYAASVPKKELVEQNIIARVTSRDLVHWTHHPPAFSPEGHAVVECPDVYFLNDRWWMTCNAGHQYGARAHFTDPYVTWGTIYASADRLEGPYHDGPDNVLIGSMEFNGFCCRTSVWKGKRYLFYGQGERKEERDRGEGVTGTLTTPKELLATANGELRPIYSPVIEQVAGAELFADPDMSQLEEVGGRFGATGTWTTNDKRINVTSAKSWSVRLCGPQTENFIFEAMLSLQRGRAIGLLFRRVLTISLDALEQAVVFTNLTHMQPLDSRRVQVELGRSYHLRIIAKRQFFEAHLDNKLILNFVRYEPITGKCGLYIESGEGTFSNIRETGLQA